MDLKMIGSSSPASSTTTREEETVAKRPEKRIKFKFKCESGENEMDQESNEKVCEVCNKVFGSAKALGGHIKVHYNRHVDDDDAFDEADLKTNLKMLKLKSKKNEKREMVKVMGSPTPTCVLCGKRFPSMKSLFGHMRCHPDREWRGIHPPASSEVKREEMKSFELLSWPSSAKRSRRSNLVGGTTDSASASDDPHQQTEDLIQAVCGLMYLARGSTPPKKRSVVEDYENKFDPLRKKKKSLKDAAGDLQVGYTCSICHKRFPTHQALGGHRSSHNKCNAAAAAPALEEAVNSLLLGLGGEEVESSGGSKPALYKCKICDKSFYSGQALGGHKRCHFNGPLIADNQASPHTTTTVISSVGSKEGEEEASKKRMDFDLNKLPAMEFEDEGGLESEKPNERVPSSCSSAT